MTFEDAPSPNHDDRNDQISMLVLHYTGMETGAAALERLRDPASKVSAHYLVLEDGRVVRLVEEERRAWHAGAGSWRGIDDVNSASIGIEIVNGGHEFGLPEFPAVQIEAVVRLSRDIVGRYGIAPRDVVGHSDVAPGRKQDPGERFPWAHLAQHGVGLWPGEVSQSRSEHFRVGASGEPVADVQRTLSAIGYGLEVDSHFGLEMEAVVVAFQRRFRPASIDGIVDAQTAALITHVAELCRSAG